MLAQRNYFQPCAGCEHQQFQGVGAQLAGVAAIGINQSGHLILERQRQHQNLFIGRTAELSHELSAHFRDVARRCHSIVISVGHRPGIQIERKILHRFLIAETASLPS